MGGESGYPARLLVNLRCEMLSLLRIHSLDCERCSARETHGGEMRKRLEELNWRTTPRTRDNGDQSAFVEVLDSAPGGVSASRSISREEHPRKEVF